MAFSAISLSALVLGAAAQVQYGGGNAGPSGRTTITVNAAQKYQGFDGMGFSEAFQRGTQIYGAGGLSAVNTSRVLDLLYSNVNGWDDHSPQWHRFVSQPSLRLDAFY